MWVRNKLDVHTNISFIKTDLTRLIFRLNVLASRRASKGRWNLPNAVKPIYAETVKFLGEICIANLCNDAKLCSRTKFYSFDFKVGIKFGSLFRFLASDNAVSFDVETLI